MTTTETLSRGARAINARFEKLANENRKALICYTTAGYPSFDGSVELLQGLQEAGADIVEIGVPFSDPMADGPVIQNSSQVALDAGIDLDRTFEIIKKAELDIPVVLFSYLNPILAAGPEILSKAYSVGCDGLLITDLPVGADPAREQWIAESDLAFIRLVAPTTPVDRIKTIAQHGSGFVYLISRLGVTGIRDDIANDLPSSVKRVKDSTSLPVCIGFGISTPSQAAEVAALSDGVIIGTALVKAAGEDVQKGVDLVRSIRLALDSNL